MVGSSCVDDTILDVLVKNVRFSTRSRKENSAGRGSGGRGRGTRDLTVLHFSKPIRYIPLKPVSPKNARLPWVPWFHLTRLVVAAFRRTLGRDCVVNDSWLLHFGGPLGGTVLLMASRMPNRCSRKTIVSTHRSDYRWSVATLLLAKLGPNNNSVFSILSSLLSQNPTIRKTSLKSTLPLFPVRA